MSLPPPVRWYAPPPGPAPLGRPQYDATPAQAASRFWRQYAVFSGRASRSEYWWWALVAFLVSGVLQLGGSLALGGGLLAASASPVPDLRSLFGAAFVPAAVWGLVTLVPTIALTVRRLHDSNRSGWWYLLNLPVLPAPVLELVALRSFDPARLAGGDPRGLPVGPLVGAFGFSVAGVVCSIVLLVFLVVGPDPRGVRFDRPR